ncbi:Uncharacterised protein at_DN2234 [Pycnogonum litorale]
MESNVIVIFLLLLGCIVLANSVTSAAPAHGKKPNRIKRSGFSDQTLAKFETLLALGKLKDRSGFNGFGVVDPSMFMKRSGFSDQKLAQMETRLKLGELENNGFHGGFGFLDPSLIGKRLSEIVYNDKNKRVRRWNPSRRRNVDDGDFDAKLN